MLAPSKPGVIDLRHFAPIVALILASCAAPDERVAAAHRVSYVSVSEDRLAYIKAGRGAPVVFVHGGFQDYRLWLPFVPAFAAKHRVIAYSRRNHYPNNADRDGMPDFAADAHAADLLRLVEDLRLGPVHVVAHSSGAATALFFAARNPGLVRSLAVVEPPLASLLTNAPEDRKALADFTARFSKALAALREGDDDAAVRLFADAVGGPGTYDRRTDEQKRMMLDNIAAHAADARSRRQRPSFSCAMARTIRSPVLLISGTRSPPFFHRVAHRLADCLPNVTREQIESSHTVPGENPARFQEAVMAFLLRQGDS